MPAVKKLHQSSTNNSKPSYIFGHALQTLGLLVSGPLGHLCCVPLCSPIHEGVVFSNRDQRTLLDKLAMLFLGVVSGIDVPGAILVAQALRDALPEFLLGVPDEHNLKKFLLEHTDSGQCPPLHLAA